nr:LysM peptidoglycan-binding domain-containing M23 family metallopeptidase [Cypionkella aquatica]
MPVLGMAALLLLSACSTSRPFDWDLRAGNGSLDTSDAALRATDPRPAADARGVLSYPTYQAAVAQKGDTVASVAGRIGLPADQLAKYNGLTPTTSLREGEVLALPARVAAAPTATSGGVIGSMATPGTVDVSSIATTALDRVGTTSPTATPAKPAKPAGTEPVRHQVKRGETAFSIARIYNISARSIADWNGLGPDLEVREGQFLIIPTANSAPPVKDPVAVTTPPGSGSPTPEPPSAKKPLPAEKPAKASEKPAPAADLGKDRTAASATKFTMPVNGKVIRAYAKKKNDGIDISAPAGTAVKSAADGTVAAVTKDTTGTPIVVIRHADGILTVYAGVDGLKVAKGDKVSKGQSIAVVRPGDPAFVHFEVRKGVDSVDPMAYLQ